MKLIQFVLSRTAIALAPAVAIVCLSSGCHQPDSTASHEAEAKNVLTLTKDNFQIEVLSSPQPVLVDFWATWCGPCKMVAPTVAELATEFEGKAKVGKVDVDAQTELAKQYDISAIPALMIFNGGKVVGQFVGVRSKSELKAALEKFVATAPKSAAPNP
jgi:thioredoxin 1